MVHYWWSQKAEDAYKAIGRTFEKHPFENAYDKFLRRTKSSKDNEYIIPKLIRYQIPEEEGEREYIIYDLTEIRRDALGNRQSFTRTNLGIYPIPEAHKETKYDEDMQPTVVTTGIDNITTGYEFPFTVEKAEELHKLGCIDRITSTKTKRTQYIVQKHGENKISVVSYKDWLIGDFETLYQYGNAAGTLTMTPVMKTLSEKKQKELERKQRERSPYPTTLQQETSAATTATTTI